MAEEELLDAKEERQDLENLNAIRTAQQYGPPESAPSSNQQHPPEYDLNEEPQSDHAEKSSQKNILNLDNRNIRLIFGFECDGYLKSDGYLKVITNKQNRYYTFD